MKIFEFQNYKRYVLKRVEQLPARGRGELSRISRHLEVHTTMVSHVLKGEAHFSLEQALKLADYLSLNDLETDYLVALVQLDRAGDKRARDYCRAKLEEIRAKALDLKERLGTRNELSEQDRALYYSSALYAQIRLLTAIERFQSEAALVAELALPARVVRRALDFLISRGLCREERGGRIVYGDVATYVEADSPFAARLHANWRQKTQESFESLRKEDLVFTYPTVISEMDFLAVREKLVRFFEEFKKTAEPSPSESLFCLNVDWVKLSS